MMSQVIAAQSEDTRLWLRAEMDSLVDPMLDSLFFRLIMSSSSASFAPQSSSSVSELCRLIEAEKEWTNGLLREEMDRVVSSLSIRLTNKLLVNIDLAGSGHVGGRSQLGNPFGHVESPNPSGSTSTSSFNPHQTDVSQLMFQLLAAEKEDSKLWLRGEMVRVANQIIDSLFLKLIMTSSAVNPTMFEICQFIEGHKEETNIMHRREMNQLTNSLFLRLTNKLLVNMERARSRYSLSQTLNPSDQVESFNPQSHQRSTLNPDFEFNFLQPNSSDAGEQYDSKNLTQVK